MRERECENNCCISSRGRSWKVIIISSRERERIDTLLNVRMHCTRNCWLSTIWNWMVAKVVSLIQNYYLCWLFPTYTIDINIAAEGVHVEHEAIVDEIHRKPNAEEAECNETKIFRLEQFNDTRWRFVGWRLQILVNVVGQLTAIEPGRLSHNLLHLAHTTFAQEPPWRLGNNKPVKKQDKWMWEDKTWANICYDMIMSFVVSRL